MDVADVSSQACTPEICLSNRRGDVRGALLMQLAQSAPDMLLHFADGASNHFVCNHIGHSLKRSAKPLFVGSIHRHAWCARMTWKLFVRLPTRCPLPPARVVHCIYGRGSIAWEPNARIGCTRICGAPGREIPVAFPPESQHDVIRSLSMRGCNSARRFR